MKNITNRLRKILAKPAICKMFIYVDMYFDIFPKKIRNKLLHAAQKDKSHSDWVSRIPIYHTAFFLSLSEKSKLDIFNLLFEKNRFYEISKYINMLNNVSDLNYQWYDFAAKLREKGYVEFLKKIQKSAIESLNSEPTKKKCLHLSKLALTNFNISKTYIIDDNNYGTYENTIKILVKQKSYIEASLLIYTDDYQLKECSLKIRNTIFFDEYLKHTIDYFLEKGPDEKLRFIQAIVTESSSKLTGKLIDSVGSFKGFKPIWYRLARQLLAIGHSKFYKRLFENASNPTRTDKKNQILELIILGEFEKATDWMKNYENSLFLVVLHQAVNQKFFRESFEFLKFCDNRNIPSFHQHKNDKVFLESWFKILRKIGYNTIARNIQCKRLTPNIEYLSFLLLHKNMKKFYATYKKLFRSNKTCLDRINIKANYYLYQKKFHKVISLLEFNKNYLSNSTLLSKYLAALKSEFEFEKIESVFDQHRNPSGDLPEKLFIHYANYLFFRGDDSRLNNFFARHLTYFRTHTSGFTLLLKFYWLSNQLDNLRFELKVSSPFRLYSMCTIQFVAPLRTQEKSFEEFCEDILSNIERYRIQRESDYYKILSLLDRSDKIDENKCFFPSDYEALSQEYKLSYNYFKLENLLRKFGKYGTGRWVYENWLFLYMHDYKFDFKRILDERSNLFWDYSTKTRDNFLLKTDVVFQHYLWKNNLYAEGMKVNQTLPLNRYLKLKFPKQYHGINLNIDHVTFAKKTLIISYDGIGDEVRWYKHFSILHSSPSEIHVTCDPRLKSILSRSFPEFIFHPIAIRRIKIKSQVNEIRGGKTIRDLSDLLSNEIIDKLDQFDLILFSKELVGLSWSNNPPNSLVNAPAYLKPDRNESFQKSLLFDQKKINIGLVLSSTLKTRNRNRHYIQVTDLPSQIFSNDKFCFHYISEVKNDYEKKYIKSLGIKIWDNIDFFNDMDDSASFIKHLDACISVSTFTSEFAAALGVPQFLIGISPETKYIRSDGTRSEDLFTIKSTLICPNSYCQSRQQMINEINEKLMDQLKSLPALKGEIQQD